MDRTTPIPGNEEIELYRRTYYSLLRSSGEVEIRSLEETHSGMYASLHQQAAAVEVDLGAFVYVAMRLPTCLSSIRLVLLAPSAEVFNREGYADVEGWIVSTAAARRRKMFFDGEETLAIFINSVSDIDDLVPMLTTFQIEWNKMHAHLKGAGFKPLDDHLVRDYQQALRLSDQDFDKLERAWGDQLLDNLRQIARAEKRFAVRLLAGSLTDYQRATQAWWYHMVSTCPVPNLHQRPTYFISSNMHAFPNLFSSYTALIKAEIIDFLEETSPEGLAETYRRVQSGELQDPLENLLYYVMRKYLRTPHGRPHYRLRLEHEIELGIHNMRHPLNLDVGVQVIELAKLDPAHFDPRIRQLAGADWARLAQSEAVIINIDYPLGMAAYQALSQISASVGELRGVYTMGKSATLNGRVGDVMVPNVVYDEHSHNTFLFRNCFETQHIAPYLHHGTVFDNQKSVTVLGTMLQNKDFMHVFYKEGYTDIEMEAGPYLSAMYENLYPTRYPNNEIINLFVNLTYDLGILHYASDTPYSRRQSLLSKSLLYFGMDSTYAAAIAIARRIIAHEVCPGSGCP